MRKVYALLLAVICCATVSIAQPALYSFAGSTGTYTPVSGTSLTFSSQDDASTGNLPIGFTFSYNSINQTVFAASTNGLLILGQTTNGVGLSSNALASTANTIAGLWEDNNMTGGSVQYTTTGTAPNRVLTVQYTGMHVGGGGSSTNPTINLQILLFETTNVIQVIYGPTSAALSGTTASIGLSGNSGNFLSVTPTSASAPYATTSNATENTNISSATFFPSGTTYTFTPPAPCVTPGNQPTSLSLTAISASQIDGTFTAATSTPNAYLVVRYLQGATPTNPVNGTTYATGAALGAGTVVQTSSATTFSATGLLPLTFYDFYIYSVNNACSGGPLYLTASPLFGTRRTPSQTPPNCATTYTPLDAATNISITQVLSWSGATGSPAITGYNVYLSTNSALVTAEDPSVRVSTNQSGTTYTPVPTLSYGTTYYWKVTPINIIGASTGCVVNSFSTYTPTSITSNAIGGLWTSTATWAGGVVPIAGDNVTIADGAIVTVDVTVNGINNLTIGQGASGILQWSGVSNAMTLFGNLTVSSGAKFLPYTTGNTGQTINIGGNLVNNGFANLAVPSTLIIMNGSQQAGGSLGQSVTGTGTFVGDGTNGLIRNLFFATAGSSSITTSQNLTTGGFAHGAGSLNTNGKLKIDNTAQVYGQALNTQVSSVAVTNMGTGYTSAPVAFGAAVSPWAIAPASGVAGTRYYSGGNVYLCTVAGVFDAVNPPTHTSGIAANGAASLLWLAPYGTLGNPFILTITAVGTQYFYGGNLYTCTVAGIPDPANPPVHVTGAAASGAATFLYAGSAATASVNYDGGTSTVRSLNITNAGSGYSSAPTATINGGGGSGAVATAVLFQSIAGFTASSTQRSGISTISGGLTINNTQGAASQSGAGAVFATNGGVNYTVAPTIGFAGPTALNLVTAGGTGYTTAPTITLTGGTLISGTALTTSSFTITVNQGKVVSVYLNSGTTATYSVPPALAFTGGAGAGATLDFPPGCWPAATATIGANGQITNFTVTNAGFGFVAAPAVGVGTTSGTAAGGTFTTVASGLGCRVGLYSLITGFFAPAAFNAPGTDDAAIPANRKLNSLTLNIPSLNLTAPLEVFGTAPLTLTAGSLNMGGNNLLFSWNTYSGTTGSTTTNVTNGSITLTSRGGGTSGNTLSYPFDATYTTFTGTAATVAVGSTITSLTVSRTAAPTGAGNPTGTRAYNAVTNAGAVYGTNPNVNLNWNGNDNLVSDNAGLFISQSAALTGPWTVRSLTSGTGVLPATGSRTTATTGVGPIVPTGNDFFAWTSTFAPPPALNYVVTRTTAITYQSIAPVLSGGDGTGTLSTATGDETTQVGINIAAAGFTYQGSPVTAMAIHPNGYIVLNNAFNTYAAASSWDNTFSPVNNGFAGTFDPNKRNVIAPFYDDLNKATPVIYYKVVGQKVTVEWFNTTFFGLSGPQLFFQVVLDAADQSIKFNYGNMQLYNGTQNIRYSYSSGISGGFVQPIPQPGQVMQQQYENTTYFTSENGGTASWGANGLAISPDPRSSVKFTPGSYVPVPAPGATPPVNDEPAGAITRPALPGFPSNIAWDNGTNTSNLFTTRFATNTATPANCGGAANARDVWFKFVAPNPSVTVRIYGSGGFIPRVSVYDATITALPNCVAGLQGLTATTTATGLTIGSTYYVRVYHDNTGTQATATATIGGGAVTGLTITPGTNYSNPATAFSGYSPQNQGPRISFTGGGGNGAASGWTTPTVATAVLPLTAGNLSLVGGSGYTSAPTVTIESPDWGVTGEFGIILFSLPENDDCSGATSLINLLNTGCVNSQNSVTSNTQGATGSAEPTVCGTPDDDLWYKFTAINTNTYIQAQGTNLFDAAFQVYNGGVAPGDCSGKTSVICVNTNGAGALDSATITTVIGNTYYVRVYHAGAGSVPGETFTLCVSSAPPACVLSPISPANEGSACVGSVTLSWAAVPQATSYEIYLDAGAGPATTLVATQAGTSFNTAALTAGPYAWRIVPKNIFGSAAGCTNFVFVVNALPTVSVTPAGPIALCAPATQLLTGSTNAATPTYQWVNGTVNVSGATSSTYSAGTTGSFRLVATDGVTGCRDTSNTVVLTVTAPPAAAITPSAASIVCDSAKLVVAGSSPIKISEITLFSFGGTGETVTYPSYVLGDDFIEISNISASPVDVSGYTFADYANNSTTARHPFTIPASTIIPANSVLLLNLGTGTDDVANRYFNTGGLDDDLFSSAVVGFILKDASGTVVDAVGCGGGVAGSYTFAPGTGVTAAQWTGFAPNEGGFAGLIRTAAYDSNTGSDWVKSNTPSPLQTIGTYNAGYLIPTYSWSPSTGLFIDAALTIPYTGQNVGTVFAKPGTTTTYNVTVTAGICPGNGSVVVTVLPAGTIVWTGAVSTDWNNAGNWNCGGIPTITSEVVIPGGKVNYPVVTLNVEIKKLTVSPGASVTIGAGFDLKLNGN
jgi:hypothetical protein